MQPRKHGQSAEKQVQLILGDSIGKIPPRPKLVKLKVEEPLGFSRRVYIEWTLSLNGTPLFECHGKGCASKVIINTTWHADNWDLNAEKCEQLDIEAEQFIEDSYTSDLTFPLPSIGGVTKFSIFHYFHPTYTSLPLEGNIKCDEQMPRKPGFATAATIPSYPARSRRVLFEAVEGHRRLL
ncbi:hypothetical protein Y032_0018g3550 [Ancylostoma ceylanicum]|nr:hypothetical protein Y032_0018g3550 [Ancylostoma ceylanicum]